MEEAGLKIDTTQIPRIPVPRRLEKSPSKNNCLQARSPIDTLGLNKASRYFKRLWIRNPNSVFLAIVKGRFVVSSIRIISSNVSDSNIDGNTNYVYIHGAPVSDSWLTLK
jgi:hypothetical protein